jgi:sulfonate transport system substrate-binding protein
VGEAPPVFALAAGASFVYIAYELPTPEAEGILVPKDSQIKSVADLKGKKIAFNKGSDVHWLVVNALKKAGLKYTDIEPVYLAPADARAAFERGSIDAWAVWDPFNAATQKQVGARQLISATGIVSRHQFFLGSRAYAEKNQEVLKIVMDEVSKEGQWIQGMPPDIIETGLKHYTHVYRPIDNKVLEDQQNIADTFFELKLIPNKINVRSAVLAVKP